MIAVTGVQENDSPRNGKIFNFCFSYFIFHSLNDVVCFGVGAGANVLTELAVS